MERGVVEVVDAISYIKNAKIQLVGKFDSANTFNDVSSRGGWQNVIYNHWVSRENLSSFFSKAVCGLVTFHPIPNHLNSQPNKLFEYMEAGLPVIASDFPLWRQIIDKYDCGILVNPLSSCEIFSAMQWIIDNPIEAKRMGDRGRQAVLQEFNWASESLELIKSYGKLIKKC
jgi:glycosyltransferase involved in cell wall biosynthesis